MSKLFILAISLLCITACSKDKFKTIPQVKINSFGPPQVVKGDIIELTATVTDKEGDLQDTVVVIRKRYNGTTLLTTDSSMKVSLAGLGSPVKDQIELRVLLSYGEFRPGVTEYQNTETFADRNFSISLIVRDNAGNRSEVVESDKIVLKKL